MGDTIPKQSFFTSQETVDAFFKYVGKREELAKAAMKAAEHVRHKKGVSSKYEHLLDVGCGSGTTTVEFLKYVPRITAIDISEGQIEKAKNTYCDRGDALRFLVAPAEKIPVEDSTVDVIVGIFSLLHFKLDGFLKECDRILKPNGVIIMIADLPSNIVSRTATTANPSGAKVMLKMLDDLKKYAEEINQLDWHALDHHYKLYQQINGFKKSRDDSEEYDRHTSLKGFKEYWYSIPFLALPECKRICDTSIENLKKQWGFESLSDDQVQITVTRVMNIITLSKK